MEGEKNHSELLEDGVRKGMILIWQERLGGDETFLYPDYGSGHTNLHMC